MTKATRWQDTVRSWQQLSQAPGGPVEQLLQQYRQVTLSCLEGVVKQLFLWLERQGLMEQQYARTPSRLHSTLVLWSSVAFVERPSLMLDLMSKRAAARLLELGMDLNQAMSAFGLFGDLLANALVEKLQLDIPAEEALRQAVEQRVSLCRSLVSRQRSPASEGAPEAAQDTSQYTSSRARHTARAALEPEPLQEEEPDEDLPFNRNLLAEARLVEALDRTRLASRRLQERLRILLGQ